MHLHADIPQVSEKSGEGTKKTLEGEKFRHFLIFWAHCRNVFYIYASTLGTEETSEADDVFNEKAELHVFRDKVKSLHENEVREWNSEKSIFISHPFANVI